jgi:hypothetical protein
MRPREIAIAENLGCLRPLDWRSISVVASVVRAPVPAIGNTIAIAVAIHAIRHTITVTIAIMLCATISDQNIVNNATGQKTADGDQHHDTLFHIASREKWLNA